MLYSDIAHPPAIRSRHKNNESKVRFRSDKSVQRTYSRAASTRAKSRKKLSKDKCHLGHVCVGRGKYNAARRAKDRLLNWPELQIRITQLVCDGSPPPGLRLPPAKLSRKSNWVARGRIWQFESDMPSQPVRLRTENGPLRLRTCGSILRGRVRSAAADGCQASLFRDDGVCCGAKS